MNIVRYFLTKAFYGRPLVLVIETVLAIAAVLVLSLQYQLHKIGGFDLLMVFGLSIGIIFLSLSSLFFATNHQILSLFALEIGWFATSIGTAILILGKLTLIDFVNLYRVIFAVGLVPVIILFAIHWFFWKWWKNESTWYRLVFGT